MVNQCFFNLTDWIVSDYDKRAFKKVEVFFMNKQQIVLNTLVFNQQHLAGES